MSASIIRRAALLAAALVLASGSALALAEISQNGNIRISFRGYIAPAKLPRTTKAPVGVYLGAHIATTDGSTPPQLKQISLAVNSHGVLDTRGLATCPLGKLSNSTPKQALRACGKAQVGHGNVTSLLALPGQAPFASNGPLLAFNGKYKGKPAVFAQVTSKGTLALTYVIVFVVKKTHGAYGTELDATLPPIASQHGYIDDFYLALKRKFSYRGHPHSYISANCPVPKGISEASFALARSSYRFADGRKVTVELTRECKAKG